MNTRTMLPDMMAALYYDPTILPADILNDLNRECSRCRRKVRCLSDLANGCAHQMYRDFCPNAEVLYLLQPWLEKKFSFTAPVR